MPVLFEKGLVAGRAPEVPLSKIVCNQGPGAIQKELHLVIDQQFRIGKEYVHRSTNIFPGQQLRIRPVTGGTVSDAETIGPASQSFQGEDVLASMDCCYRYQRHFRIWRADARMSHRSRNTIFETTRANTVEASPSSSKMLPVESWDLTRSALNLPDHIARTLPCNRRPLLISIPYQ